MAKKKKPVKRPKLVLVKWLDTVSASGWHSVPLPPAYVETVGWLWRKDENSITVCGDFGVGVSDNWGDQCTIPMGMVLGIRYLKVPS